MISILRYSLMAALTLSGCSIFDPEYVQNTESCKILILSAGMSQKDLNIFEELLTPYHVEKTISLQDAAWDVVLSPIEHDPIDYFIEQTQNSLYRNYRSILRVKILRHETQELFEEKSFVSIETLKDDSGAYREQELALAQLKWRQQQKLFTQLAIYLEALCQK